jgi:hypothetical protein
MRVGRILLLLLLLLRWWRRWSAPLSLLPLFLLSFLL